MLTVADVIDFLEQIAPPALAADWDNVGLLLGDRAAEVRRLMTCLTLTSDVAAEAIEAGVHLVVTHHPILFRGVQRLTTATAEGRTLLGLVRAGVAVHSPHTAFDNAPGGVNDSLARRLGLTEVAPLRLQDGSPQCKLVVFVPDTDLSRVADALFGVGAGKIGQYSQCSFRLAGTGTFFGSDAANPTVGQKGRREEVSEWRLEVICPAEHVAGAIAAMRRAHSYEEPAFDVYPLRPVSSSSGAGRVGRLPAPTRLGDLARLTCEALQAGTTQVVGDTARPVQRVAVVCGAGGEFLPDAVRARADLLITGEMRFHDYLAAQAQGVALILPGHYATERFGLEELAGRLQERWPDVQVWASRRERDPVTWITR
jgi:dinuclear metal center YbgI/SA1388 family protein